MLYLCICICEIVFAILSYFYLKTYQLDGYKVKVFLKDVFNFSLSFGTKNKLKFTKRLIRLIVLLFILSTALFSLNMIFVYNAFVRTLNGFVIILVCPLIIALCHYLLLPIENLICLYYVKKAKRKLAKLDVVKIGITGSYGKTSTKNILCHILEKAYKVYPSPKNYNTKMGIVKTILEKLDDHDILIAEMGARQKGDIKEICDIVKPDHAILTTIGAQHLETFKNMATIENTKYELIDSLSKDGYAVFNGDNKFTKKLYDRSLHENKFLTNVENSFAYSENIEVDSNGCKFTLVIDGKRLPLQTRLLGECNIDNIVSACALAYLLGISLDDIKSAVKSLEPVKNRLELIKNNFCTVLDDSYNSNIVGFRQALDVLSKFKGIKIVITPGIVELGASQSQINFEIGTLIADSADYLIIMNDVNKNYILSGAISHNMKRDHIFFASSRKMQKEILQRIMVKDCVILFENDLPDNYK